jgi:hypothetical protein
MEAGLTPCLFRYLSFHLKPCFTTAMANARGPAWKFFPDNGIIQLKNDTQLVDFEPFKFMAQSLDSL